MSEGENLDYEMGPFIDYDMEPSPEQLKEIYDNGFKGIKLTPGKYAAYRASLSRFYKEYPKAKDLGVGKVSSPFKACLAVDDGFGATESQTTGDCVSHGIRNAGMVDYCIDAMFGESEFLGRFATENIYGARGWAGQGADCSTLAEYVSQEGDGGFLIRQKYVSEDGRNSVDLSRYNGNIGHNWGRSGTPAWLNKIASSNKALRVFAVKTINEARDAIAAGFGIAVCSDYGFGNTRNGDGVCEARGSWSHCFTEDSLITSTQIKQIKDIKIGDKVIGHDGNLHDVTEVFSRPYSGKLIKIKSVGLPEFKTTPEHPFLINRLSIKESHKEYKNPNSDIIQLKRVRKSIYNTIWCKAKDLKIGDRLLTPNEYFKHNEIKLPNWIENKRCKNKPSIITKPNSELSWLFGLYIADGNSINSHKIVITLSLDEMDYAKRVKDIVEQNFGLKTFIYQKANCLRVTIYSSILANSFKKWFGGGIDGIPKHIPEFLFYGWDLLSVIDGIFCGDGHYHDETKEISNTSKELIYQLRYILASYGKCPYIHILKRGKKSYPNAKEGYLIHWDENSKQTKNKHQGYYYTNGITKINTEEYDGLVYNFEVFKVNSYIANGVLVHNCMAWIGVDDSSEMVKKYGGPLFLIQNSWGEWNDGPKRNDQPDGSFYIRPKVAKAMIAAGGAYCIASVRGYNRELVYDMMHNVQELN